MGRIDRTPGGASRTRAPRGLAHALAIATLAAAALTGGPARAAAGERTGSSAAGERTGCGFPGADWARVPPESLALDPAALQEAIDFASTRGTAAMAVYRRGCLVGEDRAAEAGRAVQQHSWSLSKSVVSLLVGRAVTLGRLSVYDPVGALVPEADPAHGAITVLDLLRMTSGLHHNVWRDWNVFTPGDRVKDALTLRLDRAPGTFFQYHNSSVALLAKVVERAVGSDLQDFAQAQLFGPLGIPRDAWRWGRDEAGNTSAFYDLHMRAGDFARLGWLMERRGLWAGRRLIAASYLRDAVTPSPANPGYGYLVWLNAGSPWVTPRLPVRQVRTGRFVNSAPRDMYAMFGYQHQLVMVFPSLDLVVVRLGVGGSVDGDVESNAEGVAPGEFEHELVRRLMQAVADVRLPDPGPYRGARTLPTDAGAANGVDDPGEGSRPPGTDAELGAPGPRRARAIAIRSSRLRVRPGGGVPVKLRCPPVAAGGCEGRARLLLADGPARWLAAASVTVRLRPGETKAVRLRLGGRAMRLLAATGRARGRVTAVGRDARGGTGSRAEVTVLGPAR
ncbi:MAG TPA: serine hydrolase [Thermoleophilaceae bacterium]|jgi:CubicO group peptidase (beta-lactamase class C family)